VAIAIKTARELALLPYSQRTVSESRGGRGGPGRGGAPRGAPANVEVDESSETLDELDDTDVDGADVDVDEEVDA
jgi:hypothetical protein